jgi:hypothetical protein
MKKCKRGHEREPSLKNCRACQAIYQRKASKKFKQFASKHRAETRELFGPQLDFTEYRNKQSEKRAREIAKEESRIKARVKSKLSVSANSKRRRLEEPSYRIACNLRKRLWDVLKGNIKCGSAIEDLGCTPDELKAYLESLFEPGMSWDNYGSKEGQWSIDHVYPLSKVDLTDRDQFLKVNHYTNLKPMWHIDNLKKSNTTNV